MKKIIALLCAVACLFALCACKNDEVSEIPEGMLKAAAIQTTIISIMTTVGLSRPLQRELTAPKS